MKEKFELIKEIYKKPYGKWVLFFAFYFVFFLVITVLLRFGERSHTLSSDYEKGNSHSSLISSLLKNNYAFDYVVTLDDIKYEYSGRRYDNMELFNFQDKSFYRYNDEYFLNNSSEWIKTDNPYVVPEFLDINSVNSLINLAAYDSETNYKSGKTNYNFLLSTNTLNKHLRDFDSDFDEEPNTITVSTDEKKNVSEIILYLNSYCTLNNFCQKNLKINLQYDKVGEIDKIDSPVSE